MSYLDIDCANCGSFHHNGSRKIEKCPRCRSGQIVVMPHDYEIDARFRTERVRDEEN